MPTRESQRGERNVIASFTGSQPTIHAFRHRQAVPIGAPLVNKNLRPGCTIFSLSSSPPFVSLLSPLLCVASCLSLLCPPLSACLLQSAALIIITIIASFFPSSLLALTFTPPLNFLSLRQLHSLSLSLSLSRSFPPLFLYFKPSWEQSGVSRSSRGSRIPNRGQDAETEKERKSESGAMMSQLGRDLPT